MSHQVSNNIEQQQFELSNSLGLAKLQYSFKDNYIEFFHTEVPESMEGKGVGASLVVAAFEYAKSLDKSVIASCPFVAFYVKKHPELATQLSHEHEY